MTDTEQLITAVASGLGMGNTLRYRENIIDLSLPWPRITVSRGFSKIGGMGPDS